MTGREATSRDDGRIKNGGMAQVIISLTYVAELEEIGLVISVSRCHGFCLVLILVDHRLWRVLISNVTASGGLGLKWSLAMHLQGW